MEKLNPAQAEIREQEGLVVSSDQSYSYLKAFKELESVNRGVSLIVNGCSCLDIDVKDKLPNAVFEGIRAKTLHNLLNFRPNPYQSIQEFRSSLFTDFLLEGNIFIYFDGAHLYHLPAVHVDVIPDAKTFIAGYEYETTKFKPEEIIHVKDLSSESIYRGTSRLVSAERNIKILKSMQTFQENFFKNGTIHGLVIETENTLSKTAKERTILEWVQKYSVVGGSKKPIILDSGQKAKPIADVNFKDLDFDASIITHNTKILTALGVPSLLLDGGNNANISPNLRLFYLETVVPIVRKLTSAFEHYFGYDLEAVTNTISALQPDLKEWSSFITTLTNGGIITPNEAREELRFTKIKDQGLDTIRVPVNIAGSATNPDVGGAPTSEGNN